MQTLIVMAILMVISFSLGRVYQLKFIELKIRKLYQNLIEDTNDRDDRLINIGAQLVYEFLFENKPPN